MILSLLLAAQLVCNGTPVENSPLMILPAGVCSTPKPLVLVGDTTIIGAANYGTEIRAQRGFAGSSAKVTLRDLEIWRADFRTETGTRAIGLNLSGSSDVQRVRLYGFTIGGLIQGAEGLDTNADWTVWRDFDITGSAHAGLLVDGGVTNAGLFEHGKAISSCERPDFWEFTYGNCAGIRDGSFLMNTWVAIQFANTLNARPSFISLNRRSPGNQHSTWIGMYCERGQAKPVVDDGTIVLGGNCPTPDKGQRFDGKFMSGIDTTNDLAPGNIARVTLGRAATPGSFSCRYLMSDAAAKSRPLCEQSEIRGPALKDECYIQRIANMTRVGSVCQDGSFVAKPQ